MSPAEIFSIFESAKGKDAMDYMLTVTRAIEQAARKEALAAAIRVTAESKTTSHACDAIRALLLKEE